MDIKTNRNDFNNSIILGSGYCDKIYNFMYYDMRINSDNYYNCGYYGWNYSIYTLNNTFHKLHYKVYVINAYRNTPTKANYINYERINKYFDKIIKNYNKKVNNLGWREIEKVRKQYINKITKKLNSFISEDIEKARF